MTIPQKRHDGQAPALTLTLTKGERMRVYRLELEPEVVTRLVLAASFSNKTLAQHIAEVLRNSVTHDDRDLLN